MLKPQAFLPWAQEITDLTQRATSLYNDKGIVRLGLSGWPIRGTYIVTLKPQHRPSMNQGEGA